MDFHVQDALNYYAGDLRAVTGANATAGIFATYPNDGIRQVNCNFTGHFCWHSSCFHVFRESDFWIKLLERPYFCFASELSVSQELWYELIKIISFKFRRRAKHEDSSAFGSHLRWIRCSQHWHLLRLQLRLRYQSGSRSGSKNFHRHRRLRK